MNKSTKMTVPKFVGMKSKEKISMLTAYDFTMAKMLDGAGVDSILVGDSMAMVVQGHHTTLPVTLDEMIYHGKMVCRGVENALTIVDLPFPTNHLGVHKVIEAAGRVMKETQCQAVKLEGGAEQAEVIQALVSAGIPVMAHVGLRPQSVHTMGGYKVQREEEILVNDAKAAEQAGAFGVVVECVPNSIGKSVTDAISIPTIGIGAGPECDGQVLVINDLLGMPCEYVPRFVKQYADLANVISDAAGEFIDEVKSGAFPDAKHSFK